MASWPDVPKFPPRTAPERRGLLTSIDTAALEMTAVMLLGIFDPHRVMTPEIVQAYKQSADSYTALALRSDILPHGLIGAGGSRHTSMQAPLHSAGSSRPRTSTPFCRGRPCCRLNRRTRPHHRIGRRNAAISGIGAAGHTSTIFSCRWPDSLCQSASAAYFHRVEIPDLDVETAGPPHGGI